MEIFRDEDDYRYFEDLLARHLAAKPATDKFGRKYKSFYGQVQLHSYCLMPTHFHLLLWQKKAGAITQFMSRISIAYSMYFNLKYKRKGRLFESQFKAVPVTSDPKLIHVSRYIHLNPIGYRVWDHSSYGDYLYNARDWVTTDFVLSFFPGALGYSDFVDDYEDVKRQNDELKTLLGEA